MKNIVVIGHVDHGKTEFINAVNKVMQGKYKPFDDNTWSTGTEYSVDGESFNLFDFAGDNHYENGITGNEDMAILICALTDGPMPDTKRHLEICKEKGVEKLAVFFTKLDYVDDEMLAEIVEDEVFEVVKERGYKTGIIYSAGSPYKVNVSGDEKEAAKIRKFITAVAGKC